LRVVEGAQSIFDGARAGGGKKFIDVGFFGGETFLDPAFERGRIFSLHPGMQRVDGLGGSLASGESRSKSDREEGGNG